MTREEAIKLLTQYIDYDAETPDYYKMEEACKVAIKALSAEPCEDCISRQAVLDGIEELKKSPWATDTRGIGFEYLITEALDVVADLCVKREPSVTPKPKTDVLDKIRAEIQEYADNKAEPTEMRAYYHCLQIIDKYKTESEDK